MNNNKEPVRLLTLERTQNDSERWVKLFRNAGHPARIQQVESPEALEEALSTGLWDLLLTVETTPLLNARQALSTIRRLNIDVPVILALDESDPDTIAQWLEMGARDAIDKEHEQHIFQAILREKRELLNRRQAQRLKKELSDTEQRCQLLLDNASQAIAYVHEGMHIDANQAYLELFGYDDLDELSCIPLIDMIAPQDQALFKNLIKHFKPGTEQPAVDCSLNDASSNPFPATVLLSDAVFDGEPCIQVLVKVAQSAQTAEEEEGIDLLPRQTFLNLLESDNSPETLAYLQLDNYDHIRQSAGVDGSVAVQESVTRLLTEHLPASQLSHYGDEVYLAAISNDDLSALEPLRAAIEGELISTNNQTLYTSVSIGLAEQQKKAGKHSFLERARIASDLVREQGGNQVSQFSQSALDSKKADDGNTLAIIRQALEHDNFRLLFQPIISVTGEGQEQYEVLLRLLDPKGKEVPASEFIPAAEDNELMPFIDRWVIRQAVKQLAKKYRDGHEVRLMIHISTASLDDPEFADRLGRLLEAASLPGHLLTMQMTEEIIHQHLRQVVQFAESIKHLGCRIAMTQFSGESRSVKILQHLDVSFVKLDSMFTERLERNDDSQTKKVTNNLKDLNKTIIMPRVENAQTLTSIWQLGVDYVQGHYLQPPLEAMTYDFSG